MVAILLVGIVAYRFLPLSALPEVDYPTIQVPTLYPGASPDVMTSSVTAPLERQFGQMPGLTRCRRPARPARRSSRCSSASTLEPRRRRAGGAGGDQRRRQPAAARPAGAADLRQGQPGRRADPDPGADLEDPAADRRSRTSPTPGWRRRSRSSPASASSASAAASGRRCASRPTRGARRLRPQHRRSAHRRSATPTSTRRRAISTGRPRSYTINANDQLQMRRRISRRSSSPTATARRCGCPTSPTWSTAPRTAGSAPG